MKPVIIILGPTACGKTHLATHLAYALDGEIISADSRQVYRGMDIGTGKDLKEYVVNNQSIPYHLIDVVEAGEMYNVHRFQQDFYTVLKDVQARDRWPILCGGTGLYIEAVVKKHRFTAVPIDETLRDQLQQLSNEELLEKFKATPSEYTPLADTSTRKRLLRAIEIATFLVKHPFQTVQSPKESVSEFQLFGLSLPVEERRERITRRLHERLQNGMIEEVQQLLNRGISADRLIYYGLEYKFITQYLLGLSEYGTMVERLNVGIHQFAKRQMTFFRKMERDGLPIQWLDAILPTEELVSRIKQNVFM
ncbi:tRNA (adenosine(37)-N6)-dimethylallyltransferase MiaA [Runella slithyformis]|uniref:tRNA dimethylallyltransferase n=1 Tax=Runella slithyformis (strain ATCC 29530 / DSM 19594 / LMG 11500 / NCIMB 11436 / LSU 4) TaxID=761193 RepID=A0A7U4E889_RUNSL|nr:tRNA (adenosine(37)-N6)-dimethylallyltransferase MiaA [Runella slithyformis]AEI51103.1 tRNA dimethylallyltransferase [Runella slithyformis DSM 19594]